MPEHREDGQKGGAKPETPAEHLARLKKEHASLVAEEDKMGFLTGDVAQARLKREYDIDGIERSLRKK